MLGPGSTLPMTWAALPGERWQFWMKRQISNQSSHGIVDKPGAVREQISRTTGGVAKETMQSTYRSEVDSDLAFGINDGVVTAQL